MVKSTMLMLGIGFFALASHAKEPPHKDVLTSPRGNVEITFLGHGTLMLSCQGKIIHVDPWGRVADYSQLPKADMILITHHHEDHLDSATVHGLRKKGTTILATETAAPKLPGAVILHNGDKRTIDGIEVVAVPAYNILHKRPDGGLFHPRGEGNGYVITVVGMKIYVAGDTENIPEMKALKGIDVAFLPVNLPYTMTPEMAADAVKAFRPKIFYPYHYGNTDVQQLVSLLKDVKDVEVRIRNMK